MIKGHGIDIESIAAIEKNEEELKQAKEAAERANAAKTGFL